jgi:hypothetical protein
MIVKMMPKQDKYDLQVDSKVILNAIAMELGCLQEEEYKFVLTVYISLNCFKPMDNFFGVNLWLKECLLKR